MIRERILFRLFFSLLLLLSFSPFCTYEPTSQIHPRRFTSPKQIQKLAGLEPKENSSGKHKGRTSISKRGRRKLRRLLFQAVLPLIRSNEDFRQVYTYYSTRKDNPLKGTQAVIAVGCKLIRIF